MDAKVQSATLLHAFKETLPGGQSSLPVEGILFGSKPSRGAQGSAFAGLSYQIPRSQALFFYLDLALVNNLVDLTGLFCKLSGTMNVLDQLKHDINDATFIHAGLP